MHALRVTILFSLSTLVFGQDAVVQKSAVHVDTVKRGDMPRSVRGLGVLATSASAVINVAETHIQQVRPGQRALLDTRNGLVQGTVRRVLHEVADGVVKVDVRVDGTLPPGAVAGLNVDGAISVEVLKDVIHVGRPAVARPQSSGILFKLAPDGQHATRVNVYYGRASIQTIEVLSGLQPGDQVIVSDMSAYAMNDRVRLQ